MRRLVLALPVLSIAACSSPPPPPSPGPVPAASSTALAPPPPASSAPVASASAPVAPPPAPDKPKPPFNVLLISVDSMRADMPWAGYGREIAPRLTALQKRAVTYSQASSISSFTSKSLGGFLGGRLPSELKRTGSFFTRYLDSNVMFAESLHDQKVHTIAGHAHAYMGKGESGFEQGFEKWQIVPGIKFDYNKDPFVTSQKMTPMAIEMLSDEKLKTEPFFAWFHYMDPHDVYQPHDESPKFGDKKPKQRDLYDQEMFFTDLWIGKLLDWVEKQEWAKKTVVVVTADHGEAFGEHKLYRHAFELYEVLTHVPLYFVVPGVEPKTIDEPRSHLDLVPTIMELTGAKPNPELRGKSFMGELFGDKPDQRDVLCDLPEDSHNERRRSFRRGDWKLIAFANDFRFELYNLKSDPGETDNLVKKEKDKAKEMIDAYKEISKGIKDQEPQGGVQKHKG